jgi:small subunit ribosomal protein S1
MTAKTQKPTAPLTGKMAELMEEIKNQKFPKMDELIKGTVINVGKNEILLDINGITTGMVRGKELEDESGQHTDLKIGDQAYATVLDLENERGILELSFRQAGHQKAWEDLTATKDKGTIIFTKIMDANKGGLMCKVGGVVGFMPVSQLATEHYPRVEGGDKNKILEILKSYINQDFQAKIIDIDENENKLIVSERAAWEEQQKDIINTYSVGQNVKGKITGVVDFGAFVEFGDNMEGLVHISEIAWQRIDNPRDYIKVGDEVEAKIIEINGSKISLSIKSLKTDPWKEVAAKYKIGQTLKGKVLKTNDFGAFVELDNDIHGLAHISELADYPIKTAQDVVKIGEDYEFKIVSIEPDEHRLGLSLKALKKKEEKPEVVKKAKTAEPKETDEKPVLSETPKVKKKTEKVEKIKKSKEDSKT